MGEMHTKFWLANMKGKYHSKDLGTDGKVTLEGILEKMGGNMWIGCIWLRVGTNGVIL
jgi:hypothetical protein